MKISVAVPVRNEEKTIGELLRRLLNQTLPPDEVVIADGGSQDRTTLVISDFVENGAAVRLIAAGEALPGRNRNVAAAEAKNDWVAFIDAGTEPATNWLESLALRAEQDSTIDVVYGMWEPVIDSFFAECAAISYVPPPATRNGVFTRPRSIASCLMKRSVWRSVGGFPEHLRSAEDLLFMNRVENAGFNEIFEPRATVRWHLSPTFSSTFKRFVVYARNNIRAGLWRQWQATIFTRYFLLIGLAIVLLAISPKLAPLAIAFWLMMLLARAVVAIRRNRTCYPASLARNLKRLLVLVPLLAVIDAAAIIGSIQWLFFESFRGNRKVAVEASDGA